MNRHKELLKNTAILAFGKFATQFMAFLLLPIYTHFLSPADYGTFDLILTYATLALPFLTLRLEFAAFRFLIDERKSDRGKTRIISTILGMTGGLAFVWIVLFAIVSTFVSVEYGLFVAMLAIAMVASGVFLQFARGLGSNKAFATASIIAGLVTSIGGGLSVAVLGWGIEGMLGSAIVGNILASVYLLIRLQIPRYIKLRSYDKSLAKELLAFGVPMVPSGLAWWAINGFDRTIIGLFLGVAANGVYAVASKFAFVLVSIANIFGLAWKESASMHLDAKDRDAYFSQTINTSLRIFGSLGLLLIAATPLFFGALFDAKYHEAMNYIPILVVGALFNAAVELYAGVYVAKKMSGKLATTNIIAAIISIVLNFIFIRYIGLYAAALAMMTAFGVMAIWRAFDVRKYIKITYDKNVFITLAMLHGVVICLYYVDIAWASVTGLIIASVSAYWMNRRELRRIGMLMKKKIAK